MVLKGKSLYSGWRSGPVLEATTAKHVYCWLESQRAFELRGYELRFTITRNLLSSQSGGNAWQENDLMKSISRSHAYKQKSRKFRFVLRT